MQKKSITVPWKIIIFFFDDFHPLWDRSYEKSRQLFTARDDLEEFTFAFRIPLYVSTRLAHIATLLRLVVVLKDHPDWG